MDTVTPAVVTFVEQPADFAEFEAWQAVAALREKYAFDGLDPRYLPAETRQLYMALEDGATALVERCAGPGSVDAKSAWLVYFLDQFEKKLADPTKAASVLADLQRDLAARVEGGKW
jgi:hypothetical protein